jgi:hypothetical protein
MAWTQADIDRLKEAIATGARKVRYADGRETEFRSLKEMWDTLARMESEASGQQRVLVGYVQHSRE